MVSIAVSDSLYRRHPDDDEGVLSARRAAIVSTPGLARLAARLELGEYLILGEGEAQRGGRVRPSLLASAFEALVGAIFLDLGWEVARDWILALAADELAADHALTALKSPKSRLQELTQRSSGERPDYRLVEAVGPEHEKQFQIEVVVDGRVTGVGEGPSRRIAETSAAAQALDQLRRERAASRSARAASVEAELPRSGTGRRERPGAAPWPACSGVQVVRRADARGVRPGINAVVGPNGSGKCNLADALRWALGEQGRALRIRRAEDVILAGSERRAGARAWPTSRSCSTTRTACVPVEFAVLELGRRLYRSGENDYLVNRQRVRLRDLVDLLDSAHLADNAFLFIGQGMVDQALALRPEERRPLFEEVAGVRRHERRRRRGRGAARRGRAANLARVEDILAELRPQARRLAQCGAAGLPLDGRRRAGRRVVVAAHGRWHGARDARGAGGTRTGRAARRERRGARGARASRVRGHGHRVVDGRPGRAGAGPARRVRVRSR